MVSHLYAVAIIGILNWKIATPTRTTNGLSHQLWQKGGKVLLEAKLHKMDSLLLEVKRMTSDLERFWTKLNLFIISFIITPYYWTTVSYLELCNWRTFASFKDKVKRPAIVAQLEEQLLPTLTVLASNPPVSKNSTFFSSLNCIDEEELKKMLGMDKCF